MGCSTGDADCDPSETPAREVRITREFAMQVTEVTQAQWTAVMGYNRSVFKGDDLPVATVSWHEVQEFLAKLDARRDGYRYRLPTEAEWEYAARGGSTAKNYGDLDAIAWYIANSDGEMHAVKGKQPNRYGLHDMLGNARELCGDWYDPDDYRIGPTRDPKGPASSAYRVLRGGAWHDSARWTRVSHRDGANPWSKNFNFGFRCARERQGDRAVRSRAAGATGRGLEHPGGAEDQEGGIAGSLRVAPERQHRTGQTLHDLPRRNRAAVEQPLFQPVDAEFLAGWR